MKYETQPCNATRQTHTQSHATQSHKHKQANQTHEVETHTQYTHRCNMKRNITPHKTIVQAQTNEQKQTTKANTHMQTQTCKLQRQMQMTRANADTITYKINKQAQTNEPTTRNKTHMQSTHTCNMKCNLATNQGKRIHNHTET